MRILPLSPDKPYDTMFFVTDPDMVFEWDQTSFTLDQTDDGKGPTEKTMLVASSDNGECVANKSSVKWTLTGGSFMNGDSLPGCATPPSKSLQLSLMKDPPVSILVDPATGKGRPCHFYPHPSGGFSYDLAPLWMKEVVGPCLPRKEGKKAYALCDGYGVAHHPPHDSSCRRCWSCSSTASTPHKSCVTGCRCCKFPEIQA